MSLRNCEDGFVGWICESQVPGRVDEEKSPERHAGRQSLGASSQSNAAPLPGEIERAANAGVVDGLRLRGVSLLEVKTGSVCAHSMSPLILFSGVDLMKRIALVGSVLKYSALYARAAVVQRGKRGISTVKESFHHIAKSATIALFAFIALAAVALQRTRRRQQSRCRRSCAGIGESDVAMVRLALACQRASQSAGCSRRSSSTVSGEGSTEIFRKRNGCAFQLWSQRQRSIVRAALWGL